MPSPWRHAFIEIEDSTYDVQRWITMIQLIRDVDVEDEDECDALVTFALDQFYLWSTRLPALYDSEKRKRLALAPPGIAVDLDLAASG